MESWQDIQKEIAEAGPKITTPGVSPHDYVRRQAYKDLVARTGRPLIVYVSAFHVPGKGQFAGGMMSIDLADKDGFQEVVRNVDGPAVDVFVHSPGGSAEATESIVSIIRSRFSDIRFIVTGTAKSAATMLVMSGNRILMSDAAELGPTDPQEIVGNARFSPAGAILDEFTRAKKEVSKNPSLIGPWLPILQQFGPSLLVECQNHIRLSETLVAGWLEQYMFKGEKTARKKAKKLSRYLANDKNFLTHSRRVDRSSLSANGAYVDRVEDLPEEIYKAIVRLHLAVMKTLEDTNAIKIFENSEGGVLIRQVQAQIAIPPQLLRGAQSPPAQ